MIETSKQKFAIAAVDFFRRNKHVFRMGSLLADEYEQI